MSSIFPFIQLNNVVFPDPLGPIRENISPFSTEKDTSSSATTPANRMVRFSMIRSAINKKGSDNNRSPMYLFSFIQANQKLPPVYHFAFEQVALYQHRHGHYGHR